MDTNNRFSTYIKLLTSAFLWGGTFIAAKILAKNIEPFSAAFVRFFIASIFLIALTFKIEKGFLILKRDKIFPVVILGLTGIFSYNFCFFSGLKYIEAGRASVIVANNPILIALFSSLLFKEKLTPLKLTGILISVTGAIIVITKGNILSLFHDSIGKGELYIFGTVASWVTYSLVGKVFLDDFTPLQTVTYSVVIGTIFLVFPAYGEGVFGNLSSYSLIEWAALFYLGLFGTVIAFVFYYHGIEQIGPTRAGLFINFVPVSGVFLSFLVLGESLTFSLLLGLVFVSTGVILTNKKDLSFIKSFNLFKQKNNYEGIKDINS